MQVLHIGKYYPPFHGGIENYMGDLLPALKLQGIGVAALVHQGESDLNHPDFVYRSPSYGQLFYAPISPKFPLLLAQLIDRLNPNILHLHLPNTSAFWVLSIAKARKIPWVIHWHADVEYKSNLKLMLAYQAYRPLEKKLLSRSHAIITTSPAYLESSLPLARWKEKTHVIPLGLDTRRMTKLSSTDLTLAINLWGKKHRKVLAVSRMSHYKGLNFLIEAVSQVDSIQLIIVGPNTRKSLQALTHKLHVEDKVLLADAQPATELHALMATCDCLCLPSIDRAEAFGLVLLEAMHYGKPSIASDIPGSGVGWVVQHNKTGRLVPPQNAQRLAQELTSLGNDNLIWKEMGSNAKNRFDTHFNIQYSATRISDLYNIVLEGKQ